MVWTENAGAGVSTQSGPTGSPFKLVSGVDTTLLPYAGFQFGP
jgi:hypothetical protein